MQKFDVGLGKLNKDVLLRFEAIGRQASPVNMQQDIKIRIHPSHSIEFFKTLGKEAESEGFNGFIFCGIPIEDAPDLPTTQMEYLLNGKVQATAVNLG